MDFSEINAEQIVKKIMDKGLASDFTKNPAKIIEVIVGKDLPDEKVNAIIKAAKSKLGPDVLDKLADTNGDGKLDLKDVANLAGGFLGRK